MSIRLIFWFSCTSLMSRHSALHKVDVENRLAMSWRSLQDGEQRHVKLNNLWQQHVNMCSVQAELYSCVKAMLGGQYHHLPGRGGLWQRWWVPLVLSEWPV